MLTITAEDVMYCVLPPKKGRVYSDNIIRNQHGLHVFCESDAMQIWC